MREKFRLFKPKIGAEKKEVSSEEKEKREIEMIEKSPLFCQDKMELALTYLGEKPVSWIDVSKRYYKKEKGRKEDKILNELKLKKEQMRQILNKIGFNYEVKNFRTEEQTTYNSGHVFTVSKNSENLSRFKKATEEGDDRNIGLYLGYPETAVEGYINKDVLDYKELPKEEKEKIIKEKTFKFLDFHLSKDHWQEELKTVRRQQGLIKEKFPHLYKEIEKRGVDELVGAKGRY